MRRRGTTPLARARPSSAGPKAPVHDCRHRCIIRISSQYTSSPRRRPRRAALALHRDPYPLLRQSPPVRLKSACAAPYRPLPSRPTREGTCMHCTLWMPAHPTAACTGWYEGVSRSLSLYVTTCVKLLGRTQLTLVRSRRIACGARVRALASSRSAAPASVAGSRTLSRAGSSTRCFSLSLAPTRLTPTMTPRGRDPASRLRHPLPRLHVLARAARPPIPSRLRSRSTHHPSRIPSISVLAPAASTRLRSTPHLNAVDPSRQSLPTRCSSIPRGRSLPKHTLWCLHRRLLPPPPRPARLP